MSTSMPGGGQVTEIVSLTLRPDLDLENGDSGHIWAGTLNTIASQHGCQSIFWGRQVEHPEIAELVIDWDSLDDHKAFMESPIYGPFFENIKALLDGPVKLYHVHIPPNQPFPTVGSAPVTEFISLYFDPAHSLSAFESNFAKFAEGITKDPTQAQGIVGGWSKEEHEHEKVEGRSAKQFTAFIGWPTVDAHMEYRETDEFKECIPYLRDGPKAAQVHHIAFKQYSKTPL